MGRHAAGDGDSVHPVVAAGLAQRHGDAVGAHRDVGGRSATDSPVGWPAPPAPDGGGIGWPGDLTPEGTADDSGSDRGEEPAPTARRRGWRRIFRSGRVA